MKPALLNTALALAAGLAGGIAGSRVTGPTPPPPVAARPASPKHLTARSLTIVDDAGCPRMEARTEANNFYLTIRDSDATARIMLISTEGIGPSLLMYDPDAIPRIVLGTADNLGSTIGIQDCDGQPRITLGNSDANGPVIYLNDDLGNTKFIVDAASKK